MYIKNADLIEVPIGQKIKVHDRLVVATKSYIYFTSSKSQLIEIFAFFGKLKGFKTPFFGAQIETAQNFFGYQGNYTDIMISRFLPGSCCDQQNQKGIINF